MEIQLHNTEKVVFLNGFRARIWEGHTAGGIKVHAFISRIAVKVTDDQTQFEAELNAEPAPSAEIKGIPLRLLI